MTEQEVYSIVKENISGEQMPKFIQRLLRDELEEVKRTIEKTKKLSESQGTALGKAALGTFFGYPLD